ncbi:MAG: type II CAAX endopeptidase family protein [Anaerolineaceae bacterium]
MHSKPIKKIITFLTITFVLSTIFYALIIHAGTLQVYGGILVMGLMWVPGISGIITQLIFERTLRGMGWKLGKFKYLLLAYFIPLVYCLVVYGITWLSGLGGVPNPELMAQINSVVSTTASPLVKILIYSANLAVFGVVSGLLSGAGEEIGWRGLFVPELAKVTSFGKASLISGLIWVFWHLPLILFADYSLPGVPKWFAVVMFTIMVLGINTAFNWLRLKSGSLWPSALLHSSHNVFVQMVFTPLTLQTAITPFIIDEFGAGLAIAGIILAVIFLWLGKRLPLLQS